MIGIRDYNDYFSNFTVRIPALKRVILVSTESHLTDFIRNIKNEEFPLMVLIVPSADASAQDEDNIGENHSGLLYILKKGNYSNRKPEDFLNDMETTQNIMEVVIDTILADKANWISTNCENFLKKFNENNYHIDPEYNYLGCDGWSLSFNIFKNR